MKMSHRVDQFAAVHEKKEGELYVDWDAVRKFANSGPEDERQLAKALMAMGRRVEERVRWGLELEKGPGCE